RLLAVRHSFPTRRSSDLAGLLWRAWLLWLRHSDCLALAVWRWPRGPPPHRLASSPLAPTPGCGPGRAGKRAEKYAEKRAEKRIRAGPIAGRPGRVTASTASALQVEPVQVHHLVPRRDEVVDELLLRVVGRVDLGDRPQLRVRPEDEVDPAGGPLELAGGAVTAFEGLRRLGGRLPLRAHVQQVD